MVTKKKTDFENLSAFELPPNEIERLLETGESEDRLVAYFGRDTYAELRELSRKPRRAGSGKRVLILPGLMGSTIGKRRMLLNNTIWFDPVSIIAGELRHLSLNSTKRCTALGIIPFYYTRLKLTLARQGFDVDYHFYDWRLSVEDLGQDLAERLVNDAADDIFLVAHSMGGLVSRAAMAELPDGGKKVKRLIMLGTPNHGSFVPVQVFRGVADTLKKVAALDMRHSAQELVGEVFNTFPSLYEMLPTRERFSDVDLYNPDTWRPFPIRPRSALLREAMVVQSRMAPVDERFCLIAGINQRTITGLRLADGEFEYHESGDGDGTVPLALAQLPGMVTYYIQESHGGLPTSDKVCQCVHELIESGASSLLPQTRPSTRAALRGDSRDAELARKLPFGGRRGEDITAHETREILETLMSPKSAADDSRGGDAQTGPAASGAGWDERYSSRGIIVSRPAHHRLDLVLDGGSITEVRARAYVLGLFQGVTPSGPAKAIDELVDGVIGDFVARRMFSGEVGEVFMLPTGGMPVMADVVLFVGLGQLDQFAANPDKIQRFVAANVIRTLIRIGIDEFATVLVGGGSGQSVKATLVNLVRGFVDGLRDVDRGERTRRVILCENHPKRYEEMKEAMFAMARTELFDNVGTTIFQQPLRAARRVSVSAAPTVSELRSRIFLHVRQQQTNPTQTYEAILLTAGGKATAIPSSRPFTLEDRDALLAPVGGPRFDVDEFGKALAKFALSAEFVQTLGGPLAAGQHLVVVHDEESSKLPWETLRCNGRALALDGGISRKYLLSGNFSVAKWLEQRRFDKSLDILLVVDPTEDLPGAEKEGNVIRQLIKDVPQVKVAEVAGKAATRQRLLREFQSGAYDVIHYAGHAKFDPRDPGRSGIECSDQVLTGEDLAVIGNLPALVFFNACESARVRKAAKPIEQLQTSVSFAEAFLRGGIANFVGTYWPVEDASAEVFAKTFYGSVVQGQAIGDALIAARNQIHQLGSFDWADYIHYGDPDFKVKSRGDS